jgi:putative peptidoglycan lipid II flippase
MRERVKNTISSINGLLSKEQTEIIKIASLLIIPSILTKITGQVCSLIMASFYGTSGKGSLFIVADALPQMVANILLFGVVGAVVIPVLVEVKQKENKERFLEFYSTVFNLALIMFSIAAVIIVIFADRLMPFVLQYLIDPNQKLNQADVGLVVDMMRALFIPQILLGASVFIGSGLNVYNRFLLPQLSPLFYNAGMLIGYIIFIPLFDKSPWALVAGVIIGSILHLLLPIPLSRSLGLQVKLVINLRDPYLHKLIKIAIPRLLAFSSEQIASMANKFISFGYNLAYPAAQLYVGSIINAIPMLFGYTFAVASFPTLAGLYTDGKHDQFREVVNKTINQMVFLSIPFVVTLMILRLPVVRLVYGLLPGQFDRDSTYLTAWLLMFMSFGVIFSTIRGFVYRIFYAAHNTRIPLFISLISMAVTVIGSIYLSNYFSHFSVFSIGQLRWNPEFFLTKADGIAAIAGIGLSTSLAVAIEVILLMILFHRRIIKLEWQKLLNQLLIKLGIGVIMGGLMFAMYKMWEGLDALPVDADPSQFTGSTTLNLIILTTITVFTSFMVYYLLCILFQIEEIKILRRFLNPLLRLGGIHIK